MNDRYIEHSIVFGCVLLCLMLFHGTAMAQPLVTGDLSVYYSFDDFEGIVPDLSGHDVPLNGDIYGIIGKDSDDAVRGSSAFIFSEPLDGGPFVAEHFIAIGGCDVIENIEACDEIPPERVPSTGYTVATWLKLQSTGGDQSIHQVRSTDGSFVVHAQAQADSQLRLHLRGQLQAENIAAVRTSQWNESEWFHFAATYDQPNNLWAMYYNGEAVAAGAATENAGNIPLGDWGQGSLIGITADRGRQAYGRFDEYYIFTRAITPEEVLTLYELVEPTANCDFNTDGACDVADIDNLGTQIIAGSNNSAFDMNSDGQVNLADQDVWRMRAAEKNGFGQPYLNGDADLNGSVVAGDLNVIGTNWLTDSATDPWSHGDFNADGNTSAGDLNLLALNWLGNIAAAPVQAVPESTGGFPMLFFAAMTIVFARDRRASRWLSK